MGCNVIRFQVGDKNPNLYLLQHFLKSVEDVNLAKMLTGLLSVEPVKQVRCYRQLLKSSSI